MAPHDTPFAYAGEEWHEAGWDCFPLPSRSKTPPPDGYTGAQGRPVVASDVETWIRLYPDGNVGLRMPVDVVGIDVDAYKEEGARSWAELGEKCGSLPLTWIITSRQDGVSGIRLYRVPPGTRLRSIARPGIEIIQRWHRYAVTWPSVHPTGLIYRLCFGEDDEADIPSPSDLPYLPNRWVTELSAPTLVPERPQPRFHAGDWSHAVQAAYSEAMAGMTRGSRHDTCRDMAMALARLEHDHHPGATAALESLGAHFCAAIVDRATPDEAAREWSDLLLGARVLVSSTPSYRPPWEELVTRPSAAAPDLLGERLEDPDLDPDDLSRFLDPDIDDFLAGEEPPYDWVIPEVAESGDRIILTGEEGKGKSTLLRQVSVQVAAGIHPFTGEAMEPARVLIIDCENSRRQTRRKIRPLRELVTMDPSFLRVNIVGHALDLTKPAVYQDIALRVKAHQPRLIVIGPLYKMTDGDPTKEEPAKALADALDALRAVCGSALLIEAHTPYADGSRSKRPIRPYGASLWSRWPEFGVFLAPNGELEHWRGARDERSWPRSLERSSPWPWAVGEVMAEPESWDGPTHCMEAVALLLERHPGEEMSRRQVLDKLRGLDLSFRDKTVAYALEKLAARGTIRWRKGPRNADLYRFGEDGAVDNLEF